MSGVLVIFEDRAGKISRISWEAVAAGHKLAASLGLPVTAAVIGAATESLAAETASKITGKVIRV
jgi:electron transfer flavoprotein alpha subunit